MILNDTQSRQLRRFNNFINFHKVNASVYANYEPYNLAFQETNANFIILKSYIPQKDYDAAIAKLMDGDLLPYVTQVTNAVTPLLKNADYKKMVSPQRT